MNNQQHLFKILKESKMFFRNDELQFDLLYQAAQRLEAKLLAILSDDIRLKKIFFKEVNSVLIFDKIQFQEFILSMNQIYPKKNYAFKNWKKYSKDSIGIPSELKDENYIIKGDNFQVLSAIKPIFKGKIKCIYIDPPYNTGNGSFSYSDKCNSNFWLSQIEKCLRLAHELLTPDGVLFVSCDDHEFAYLKVLLDTIFKRENFIEHFSWKKTDTPSNLPQKSKKVLEYILCYEKNRDAVKYKGYPKASGTSNGLMNQSNAVKTLWFPKNKVDTALADGVYEKGTYGTKKYRIELLEDTKVKNGFFTQPVQLEAKFKWSQKKLDNELSQGTKVSIRSSAFSPSYEKKIYQVEAPLNYIDSKMGIDTTENAGKDLTALFGKEVFSYPKSESLMAYLFNMISNKLSKDDYILDFYLGSGTTAAAAHKLGYRYIGIEHADYIREIPVERLKKVIDGEQTGISKTCNWTGGGSFVAMELTLSPEKNNFKDAILSDSFFILKT
tara:strand:+ start:43412 stop:44902 length:1491 start_codon:yes stop_codon:yes gene_type:complete